MQSLFLGIAVLACPVGMGLMMWMMMRGQRKEGGDGRSREVEELRSEINRLKTERAARSTP